MARHDPGRTVGDDLPMDFADLRTGNSSEDNAEDGRGGDKLHLGCLSFGNCAVETIVRLALEDGARTLH